MEENDIESTWGKKFETDDFYWDERGYRVFTEKYLLNRGRCCNSNCRHCPYKEKQSTTKK